MDLDKEIENVLIALDDIDKYCNSLSKIKRHKIYYIILKITK